MIDTHAHIYLPDFKEDLSDVLERAASVGITDIMMPAINSHSLAQMSEVHHPGICFHKMVGIHPCDVNSTKCNLEATLLAQGSSKNIIAIGETGLDYYWSKEHIDAQKTSLRQHCKVAKDLNKPIILHNRDSTEDLLQIIREQQDGRLKGIWHCFNGTKDQAQQALDLNLHLGIGGVLTFKNAGVDLVVKDLPLDRLVLETDCPYLAPAPERGKRNEPSYMKYTAQKLADIHEISLEEIDRITTVNARRLFGIS